jgi:hypothetical protein
VADDNFAVTFKGRTEIETMLTHYEDILSRIGEPPRWFDEQGVPRYCEFAPRHIANIYADECALLAIECQSCARPFLVALDAGTANRHVLGKGRGQETPWRTLADIIRSHEIHYGDPPNVDCCGVGHTQNSTPRRVLEYWERIQETYIDPASGLRAIRGWRHWQRDYSLEIEIPDAGE